MKGIIKNLAMIGFSSLALFSCKQNDDKVENHPWLGATQSGAERIRISPGRGRQMGSRYLLGPELRTQPGTKKSA